MEDMIKLIILYACDIIALMSSLALFHMSILAYRDWGIFPCLFFFFIGCILFFTFLFFSYRLYQENLLPISVVDFIEKFIL